MMAEEQKNQDRLDFPTKPNQATPENARSVSVSIRVATVVVFFVVADPCVMVEKFFNQFGTKVKFLLLVCMLNSLFLRWLRLPEISRFCNF